jgi:acetolactate synthase-1/2/3 large subunit
MTPDYREDGEHVHSHILADVLSDLLGPDDVVTAGNSLDIVSLYQAFRVTLGQRVFTNINYGAMGWDLPGAIGACVGHDRRRTVLVTGDGSIQLNLQELQTIKANRLPIKIFVYSNRGYQSIRSTQEAFFEGFYVGSDEGSGVSCPPFDRLAAVYDFPFERARTNDEVHDAVARTLAADGPALCEVMLSPKQERKPRVRSFRRDDGTLESRPLEDMYPFLPREEIHENMHLFDGDAA